MTDASRSRGPNPFNPNSVVSHSLFAGRYAQVHQILGKLALVKNGTPSSFFFRGEKGVGKTALARLVRYIAQSQDKDLYNLNFSTAYYSAERGQEVKDVLQAILNDLTENMSQPILTRLSTHLGNLFKNGKFSIGAFGGELSYEGGGSETVRFETSVRDQVISILGNVVSAVREEDKKDGILLVIDEVNNISNIEACAQLFRGIVTTLTVKDSGYVAFILIGYADTEARFFEGDESARRLFDEVPLGPMPDDEAAEILKKGFQSVSVAWNEEVLAQRIRIAGGYPYLVQMLGHNLYEADKDGSIDEDDWENAASITALQLQSKGFSTMYTFQGKKGQREKVLDTLVNSGDGIAKSELAKKCGVSIGTYRLLPKLMAEGSIVEHPDGKLYVSSQLLKLAILFAGFSRKA